MPLQSPNLRSDSKKHNTHMIGSVLAHMTYLRQTSHQASNLYFFLVHQQPLWPLHEAIGRAVHGSPAPSAGMQVSLGKKWLWSPTAIRSDMSWPACAYDANTVRVRKGW